MVLVYSVQHVEAGKHAVLSMVVNTNVACLCSVMFCSERHIHLLLISAGDRHGSMLYKHRLTIPCHSAHIGTLFQSFAFKSLL
jgi:hypothetical protein